MAELVALIVINPVGQAAVRTPVRGGGAVAMIPITRGVEARLVAIAVGRPREGAAGSADGVSLILAVVAAVALVPKAAAGVARDVTGSVAKRLLVAARGA